MERADINIVKEHCKRRIAQLLYETEDCAESPRDKRDWYTACTIIDGLGSLPETMKRLLDAECDCIDHNSYETFRRLCDNYIWRNFDLYAWRWIPRPPYASSKRGNCQSDLQ